MTLGKSLTQLGGSVLLGGVVLAGCSVGPDYHRPEVVAAPPAQWKAGAPWKAARPSDAEIKESWWDIYSDPVLTGLELQAATNNPTVQAAFARVEQARAVARISRADLFPTLGGAPAATRERYTKHREVQPQSTGSTYSYTANDFALPLDLSYEVDLWGRVRRSFRSAREQAQASAAEYQNVLLSLQAEIAQSYFVIRSTDLERRVVAEGIELRKQNLTLVESLHGGGAASALDVARAENELATAQAELIGLNLQRARLENAMAVLCGQSATTFSIVETTRRYRPPVVPTDLASELLERRPDVAEAERSMAAASEQIGIARAAYFPSIRLTGFAGMESADLKTLFNWESREWAFGPSVSFPLFEGGRLRAGVAQARAAYEASVAQYRSQVLVAFREVEDGLIGLRLLKSQFETQLRAVEASKKVADLSRLRYKEGLSSYFEVVDADRTYLENEITAYGLNGQGMVNSVLLIKAMGGGWKPSAAFKSGSVTAADGKGF